MLEIVNDALLIRSELFTIIATILQAVDDEYYYYKRPLVTEMIISPSLLALVEKETQARKQEAVLMKTKQEKHEEVG